MQITRPPNLQRLSPLLSKIENFAKGLYQMQLTETPVVQHHGYPLEGKHPQQIELQTRSF
jgi:hypothetical protein